MTSFELINNFDSHTLYKTLTGHLDHVTSLINLPNMKFASGSLDKTILIWDIEQLFKNFYNLTCHLGGMMEHILLVHRQMEQLKFG